MYAVYSTLPHWAANKKDQISDDYSYIQWRIKHSIMYMGGSTYVEVKNHPRIQCHIKLICFPFIYQKGLLHNI